VTAGLANPAHSSHSQAHALRDDLVHDLRGAAADAEDAGVAVVPLDLGVPADDVTRLPMSPSPIASTALTSPASTLDGRLNA